MRAAENTMSKTINRILQNTSEKIGFARTVAPNVEVGGRGKGEEAIERGQYVRPMATNQKINNISHTTCAKLERREEKRAAMKNEQTKESATNKNNALQRFIL